MPARPVVVGGWGGGGGVVQRELETCPTARATMPRCYNHIFHHAHVAQNRMPVVVRTRHRAAQESPRAAKTASDVIYNRCTVDNIHTNRHRRPYARNATPRHYHTRTPKDVMSLPVFRPPPPRWLRASHYGCRVIFAPTCRACTSYCPSRHAMPSEALCRRKRPAERAVLRRASCARQRVRHARRRCRV